MVWYRIVSSISRGRCFEERKELRGARRAELWHARPRRDQSLSRGWYVSNAARRKKEAPSTKFLFLFFFQSKKKEQKTALYSYTLKGIEQEHRRTKKEALPYVLVPLRYGTIL